MRAASSRERGESLHPHPLPPLPPPPAPPPVALSGSFYLDPFQSLTLPLAILAAVFVTFVAVLAHTVTSLPAGTRFEGEYECGQGLTTVDFIIDAWPTSPTDGRGRVIFSPHENSSHDCRGEYRVRIQWTFATRTIVMLPLQWIETPCNYGMVGFDGVLAHDGRSYDGEVSHSSCQHFISTQGTTLGAHRVHHHPHPLPPPQHH